MLEKKGFRVPEKPKACLVDINCGFYKIASNKKQNRFCILLQKMFSIKFNASNKNYTKIYFPLTPSIHPALVDTTVSWKLHNRSEAVNSTCYDFFSWYSLRYFRFCLQLLFLYILCQTTISEQSKLWLLVPLDGWTEKTVGNTST